MVHHRAPGLLCPQLLKPLPPTLLAAHHQPPPRHAAPARHHPFQMTRRHLHTLQLPLLLIALPLLPVAAARLAHHVQLAAAAQRHVQHRVAEIRRQRRQQSQPPAGPKPQPLSHPADILHQLPLLDAHGLGRAARPRGVEHIGQVARTQAAGRVRSGAGCPLQVVAVEPHHRLPQRWQLLEPGAVAQQQRRLRRLQQRQQPRRRRLPVNRHIGAAGLLHRQQADDRRRSPRRQQADANLGADPEVAEEGGQAVGAAVEFAVAQGVVLIDQGDRLGTLRHLLLKHRHEGRRQRSGAGDLGIGGVVPLPGDLEALGGAEQFDLAEALFGLAGDRLEPPLQLG